MITVENDIVVGDVLLSIGYAETFTIPSDRSGMVAICSAFFFVARQPPPGPEVKWDA